MVLDFQRRNDVLSYGNQSLDLKRNLFGWFLYERNIDLALASSSQIMTKFAHLPYFALVL